MPVSASIRSLIGRVAAETVGRERHAPAFLGALVHDLLVERRKDLFAVETEREHQRRHRNLAAAVDTREHDVLGVELDVEPGAAIRNDARGKQQLAGRMGLALVVIEEHAGRTMHLRDDDALGAVHHEGAVHGHERNVAHVDVLLLDVLDGAGAGFFIDIEHDEAQRHLQRRGVGHAALAALIDVILRRLEFVAHEFQHRGVGEIRDREYRTEYRLQAFVQPPADGFVDHQELVIGCLLNLDEVRHLGDFLDMPEELANAFATGERLLRHSGLSFRRPSGRTFRSAIGIAFGFEFSTVPKSRERIFRILILRKSFRISKRKTTCEHMTALARHIISYYGPKKPEIADLPTAYTESVPAPAVKPCFHAAVPIWDGHRGDARVAPPNPHTFLCQRSPVPQTRAIGRCPDFA